MNQMGIPNFLIFLLLYVIRAVEGDCSTSYCGMNSLAIQYPFWSQDQQSQNCGLPGFNLSCNSQQRAVLNIPSSGDFYVSSIYYYIRRITLYDPSNCLPSRLLTLNLSSSPFMAVSYINYTFLSCPRAQVSSINAIDCLSNSSTLVLATQYESDIVRLSMCEKMVTLPIPVSSYDYGLSYGFPVTLELTWKGSACANCGSATSTSPSNAKPVFRIIALAFVIPAVVIPLLIVCLSCCVCMLRPDNSQTTGGAGETSSREALSSSIAVGLDEATIETYEKIILGESKRIKGPNDATCAICLAEYVPKDTLRFMPKCEHCFHVECIDNWLRMNSKCPICRTSLAHTNSC